MPTINITVAGKIATNTTPGEVIVCGNSDYSVNFALDSEWDAEPNRTARFVYYKDGLSLYKDVAFTGNTVAVPVLSGIDYVLVGVYAGSLHTTTPAKVLCDRSILCGDAVEQITPEEKAGLVAKMGDLAALETEDKSSLVAAINEALSGGATPEQIAASVTEYLDEHPVEVTGAVKTVNGIAPDENGNVEVAGGSGGNVDLTGYATEQYVKDYAQPKGDYLTEVPEGYAKTEDIPTKPEDIGAQPSGNYLTEVPSGYATEQYVKDYAQPKGDYLTNEDRTELEQKFDNVSWNNLKDKPFDDETAVLYENSEFWIDADGYGSAEVGSNFLETGETYEVDFNGKQYTCVCTEQTYSNQVVRSIVGDAFIISQNNIGNGITVRCDAEVIYNVFVPLKISKVFIKQLESKYVDLSGYVKTVNGIAPDENGNVEITIPDTGDNVSWNDLTDKPFGEEIAVLYENPEIFIDMGEAIIPIESNFVVVGETYDVEINGEVYSCVCEEPEAEEDYGLLRTENLSIVPYKHDDRDYLYLVCTNTKLVDTTISLKISGPNIKTLDTKYLPEQLQFGNEETAVLYENKAMLLEAEFGDGEPPGCYWEAIGSAFLVVGKTYDVEVNGVHYSAACYDISEDGDGTYPALDVGDIYFEPYQRNDGSWRLAVYSDEFVDTTISVKISQTNIKKLESKYLPMDEIVAAVVDALPSAEGGSY